MTFTEIRLEIYSKSVLSGEKLLNNIIIFS